MSLPMRRMDMVVGSPEWARSTTEYAKDIWQSAGRSAERWQRIVDEMETGRAWVALGYPSLDALLVAEIGVTTQQSIEVVTAAARQQGPLAANGAIGNGRSSLDIVKPTQGGNDSTYLARRLLRDAPDIFAALERGEYRSVHAAAKAAGIIRQKSRLEQLQVLWGKASEDERQAFHAWLTRA